MPPPGKCRELVTIWDGTRRLGSKAIPTPVTKGGQKRHNEYMATFHITVSTEEKNILIDSLASEKISIVKSRQENPAMETYLKGIENLQEKLIAAA